MTPPEVLEWQPVKRTDFAGDLERALRPVQVSFRQLIAEWGAPESATELARVTGMGTTICWRIWRVANATDVAAEARNVPSPTFLKKFLKAAAEAGISGETIEAAGQAAREFDEFGKRMAKDRAAFDSMLAGAAGEESVEKIHGSHRRATYRGNSHIWGLQTDLMYMGAMIRREPGGSGVESMTIVSQKGLRCLRPDVKVPLYGYSRNASATPGRVDEEGIVDVEAAERYGVPLVPEFSQMPFPKVRRVELPSGFTVYNLAEPVVGPEGEIHFTIARKGRGPLMRDTDGRLLYHQTMAHIRKPLALAIQEVLVHRESFGDVRPEFMAYQHVDGEVSQAAAREALQYPVEERVVRVGRADQVGLAEVPKYGEMLRYGAGKMGWDLKGFDVWRVRMPYPILLSATRIWFYVD